MALLNFRKKTDNADVTVSANVAAFLKDYSIEVMPRTAEKIIRFQSLLPAQTRVYIAHIEGTRLRTWWQPPNACQQTFQRHAALPGTDHQGSSDAGRLDRPLSG